MNEPPWCVKTSHDDSFIGRHASKPVTVGDRRERGEVTVWLAQATGGPVWLQILVAHMAACTVDVSVADAARLRDGLTVLLGQAGHEDGTV